MSKLKKQIINEFGNDTGKKINHLISLGHSTDSAIQSTLDSIDSTNKIPVTLNKAQLEKVLNNNGWRLDDVYVYKDGTKQIVIGNTSPAGEDLYETITVKPNQDYTEAFFEWSYNFDPDEHAEMWIKSDANGKPSNRELIEDAERIAEMFRELAIDIGVEQTRIEDLMRNTKPVKMKQTKMTNARLSRMSRGI